MNHINLAIPLGSSIVLRVVVDLYSKQWDGRLIAPVLIPALLTVLYLFLVVTQFGHSPGGFSSLSSVALLFHNPAMLLGGWVHYLAFDLFVGSWEVREAQRIGIAHYLVVPCLVLTFLFGPAGWLLHVLIKSVALRTIGIESDDAFSRLLLVTVRSEIAPLERDCRVVGVVRKKI